MKKIFILLGHPNNDTLSRMLADSYEQAAKDAAHEVRRMNIADMQFDPILHKGYKVIQPYEPNLEEFQANMTWCDHFVLVYPNWWGGMPALLKGLWDRAFMPRFAFHMHKDKFGWDKLLKGRTARLIILTGNPPFLDWLAFGDFTASVKRSILEFAGLQTRITAFGPSENISEAKKARWEKKVAALAKNAK